MAGRDGRGVTLGRDDLEKVARLARLELSERELDSFSGQLAAVLAHFARLAAVDTSGVPPAAEAFATRAPLREDAPAPPLEHEAALAGAPEREADAFVVPRVLRTTPRGAGRP